MVCTMHHEVINQDGAMDGCLGVLVMRCFVLLCSQTMPTCFQIFSVQQRNYLTFWSKVVVKNMCSHRHPIHMQAVIARARSSVFSWSNIKYITHHHHHFHDRDRALKAGRQAETKTILLTLLNTLLTVEFSLPYNPPTSAVYPLIKWNHTL